MNCGHGPHTHESSESAKNLGGRSTPDIVFLLYFSRSGSTFLSSRLDQYEDIGVTVESDFMWSLILKSRRVSEARDPAEVYGLLSGEGRFASLGFSRESFCEHLREGGGYELQEVARALLSAYFSNRKPGCRVWVIKDGANGYWINRISREMPDARFLHLIRDGRAVLNSGLRSIRPYGKGERMARDPLTTARNWKWFVDRVDSYAVARSDRYLECRYEDLIFDEQRELDRIRDFLGLEEGRKTAESSVYYEDIPEPEKSIHRLVSETAELTRADAWREELSRGTLLAFEYRASEVLKRHGYEVTHRKLSYLLLDRSFVFACAQSFSLRVLGWLRLLKEPARFRSILSFRKLYWRDGGT